MQAAETRFENSPRAENIPVWRAPGFGAITSARSTVAGAAASSGGTPIRRNYANDAEREQRLLDFGIKPLPQFTFEEIKQTQRDVLRVIAMVYDAPRGRTRADLELSLAQKLAAYHPGDPAYDLSKFEASEPKRLGNNYVQRQLLGPRPFVMDGAFADIAGRGSNSRRASTAVAAAAAAAQTGLLRFPATVTGTDRQVDRESLRLAQLIPNLQFPAGIAAARALAAEPENIRSGVLHLPEPEGDILMGLHPSSHAAYRWCGRCGTDVSTRFHNWYLHILKCDPVYYQNELAAFFASRAGAGTPVLPPFGFPGGVKMSVPEEQHALVSRAKYMAALNGLGPDRVTVVVNAAKYFKAFGDPSEILERVEAVSRWIRNENLLKQILGRPGSNRVKMHRIPVSDRERGCDVPSPECQKETNWKHKIRPDLDGIDAMIGKIEPTTQTRTRIEMDTKPLSDSAWTDPAVTQSSMADLTRTRNKGPTISSTIDPYGFFKSRTDLATDRTGSDTQASASDSTVASLCDEQRYSRIMHHLSLARSMDEVMEIKSEFERTFGSQFERKPQVVRKRPRGLETQAPSHCKRLLSL